MPCNHLSRSVENKRGVIKAAVFFLRDRSPDQDHPVCSGPGRQRCYGFSLPGFSPGEIRIVIRTGKHFRQADDLRAVLRGFAHHILCFVHSESIVQFRSHLAERSLKFHILPLLLFIGKMEFFFLPLGESFNIGAVTQNNQRCCSHHHPTVTSVRVYDPHGRNCRNSCQK